MKKLILVLAIALIASPTFAAMSVYLVNAGGNVIDVMYSGSDANSPTTTMRAVALDITINGTGSSFDSFVGGSYKIGESNTVSKGYGIYPARIVIDSTGAISDNGTPLADTSDPSPGSGFGSNNIVLEFASLYFGDQNVPPSSGKLCSLNITPGTSTSIQMIDEDTYRGGLVFEDGTLGDVNVTLGMLVPPGPATVPVPSNGATGVSRAGVTLSWTAGTGTVTSRDVYFGTVTPPPSIGNQAGIGYPTGAMTQGKLYYWKIDEKNSAGTTTGSIWSFRVEECYKTSSSSYAAWVTFGRPSCWCFQRNCRGDADGIKTGLYWVASPDLTILQSAYGKNDATLLTIPNGICADFDKTKTGLYRVAAPDLTILQSYYGKGATSVPVCDSTKVNFWTN